MESYQKILSRMKRAEVEAVAREFNRTYKISGIGKKKKQDIIVELLQNEKLLDEVFNKLYPKGKPAEDIVKKVKQSKPRKKKEMTAEDEKKLFLQIDKLTKQAMEEKSPSGKFKILQEITKIQNKLLKVQ